MTKHTGKQAKLIIIHKYIALIIIACCNASVQHTCIWLIPWVSGYCSGQPKRRNLSIVHSSSLSHSISPPETSPNISKRFSNCSCAGEDLRKTPSSLHWNSGELPRPVPWQFLRRSGWWLQAEWRARFVARRRSRRCLATAERRLREVAARERGWAGRALSMR